MPQDCIICHENCSTDYKNLLDGNRYHNVCLEGFQQGINTIQQQISEKESEKRELSNKLVDAKTIGGKFKNILRQTKFDVTQAENQVTSLDAEISSLNSSLRLKRLKLFTIYTKWPTYPPDWETRKEKVKRRAMNSCENCYAGYGEEKHVHHQNPIAAGGNHDISNLLYLCSSCHRKRHGGCDFTSGMDGEVGQESKHQKKVRLINEAIDYKRLLRFSYQKYDGDQSIRAISPYGFKTVGQSQCVRGYCYLREEERTFAIKRIKRLKIVDSPGDCYEK